MNMNSLAVKYAMAKRNKKAFGGNIMGGDKDMSADVYQRIQSQKQAEPKEKYDPHRYPLARPNPDEAIVRGFSSGGEMSRMSGNEYGVQAHNWGGYKYPFEEFDKEDSIHSWPFAKGGEVEDEDGEDVVNEKVDGFDEMREAGIGHAQLSKEEEKARIKKIILNKMDMSDSLMNQKDNDLAEGGPVDKLGMNDQELDKDRFLAEFDVEDPMLHLTKTEDEHEDKLDFKGKKRSILERLMRS